MAKVTENAKREVEEIIVNNNKIVYLHKKLMT
jgi:hypothetical protein